MWDWLHSWCCSLPTTRQKPPNQSPLLTANPQNDAAPLPDCIYLSAAAAAMLMSWLNRRRRRYLLLILCSPLLVPLLCAMCPIICIMDLLLLILRRMPEKAAGGRGGSGGGGDEVGLLHRYLEDQLTLVAAEPDESEGLGEEGGVDVECLDSERALLQ